MNLDHFLKCLAVFLGRHRLDLGGRVDPVHVEFLPVAALFGVEAVRPFDPAPVADAVPGLGPRGDEAGVVVQALDELVSRGNQMLRDFQAANQ